MSLRYTCSFVAIVAMALSACSEIREDLGLGRNSPDEFAVVDRPPLSMPPDFSLRPPRPGAARPQLVETDAQAKASVFGSKTADTLVKQSSAEQYILESAGALKADPGIREIVDRESSQKVSASPHLLKQLLGSASDNEKPATTVDAVAEAERIKKAKEENKPISEGPTPVIEKKKSGWLGL